MEARGLSVPPLTILEPEDMGLCLFRRGEGRPRAERDEETVFLLRPGYVPHEDVVEEEEEEARRV